VVSSSYRWRGSSGWGTRLLAYCAAPLKPSEGAVHRAKVAVKEVVGKVTGDAKTQAEGAAEKAAGKVQNAVAGAKDAVRDSLKK